MPEHDAPGERGRWRTRFFPVVVAAMVVVGTTACTRSDATAGGRNGYNKHVPGSFQATGGPQGTIKDVVGQPIPFGSARYFGGVRPTQLGGGVVGIAAGPAGHGYWVATAGGAVYRFGDSRAFSSASAPPSHVVAIVSTGDAGGYWLACATGQVVSYGDASPEGSAAGLALSSPIVAMAATPDGGGYWLAAAGGRVFRYGDARPYGSATPELYHDSVVAIASSPDGRGYWLAATNGQVFAFGDAHPYGSAASQIGNGRVVAMAVTPDRRGYWLAASGGRVFGYGDAHLYGTASAVVGKNPIVAMASSPDGRGYWLLPTSPAKPSVGLPAPGPGFVAGHVTSIGDSVMVDAQPALQADIPGIDVEAAVSRQWYQGVALVQQLKAEDRLGAIVVVDLGTNGPVTAAMFTQMMDVLAGASRVVFVTVHLPAGYSWRDSVNATLVQGVRSYPQDRIADFNKLADAHPGWFYGDGIHMPIGGAGAQAMAQVIRAQI
jgi:hypothetical protein